MSAFEFSFAEEEQASFFDAPSLIVAGRQDSISGYLDAVDLMHQFRRATLAVLDTAGHALAWERPEVFHALVRDWLDRLPRH
jgi:pimeloyl-ACP methyl ester carboxylesterase